MTFLKTTTNSADFEIRLNSHQQHHPPTTSINQQSSIMSANTNTFDPRVAASPDFIARLQANPALAIAGLLGLQANDPVAQYVADNIIVVADINDVDPALLTNGNHTYHTASYKYTNSTKQLFEANNPTLDLDAVINGNMAFNLNDPRDVDTLPGFVEKEGSRSKFIRIQAYLQ